jgi:adenine-specific DNA-methyltransferase
MKIQTEGIKYTGSKLKLLPYILPLVADLNVKTVLDGFSGSTRVSQAFAKMGLTTTANDISVWSETFATAYLRNTQAPKTYQALLDHLNHLKGYDGWFSAHYGGTENGTAKRPFQLKNTQKLDAIRDEIDKLSLAPLEKAVALSSLVLALDKIDNTLGHYAAYLSTWSARSYHDLHLTLPKLWVNTQENKVLRGDIFDHLDKASYDLAYFDPPYGSNNEKMPPSRVRYSAYYHIWKTVILHDKPTLFGKVNRREDSKDTVAGSVFEEFRKDEQGQFIAMQALDALIVKTKAKYILLSYSSGGRASREALHSILIKNGNLRQSLAIDYKKNVMSLMQSTKAWLGAENTHQEYLFLLEKS